MPLNYAWIGGGQEEAISMRDVLEQTADARYAQIWLINGPANQAVIDNGLAQGRIIVSNQTLTWSGHQYKAVTVKPVNESWRTALLEAVKTSYALRKLQRACVEWSRQTALTATSGDKLNRLFARLQLGISQLPPRINTDDKEFRLRLAEDDKAMLERDASQADKEVIETWLWRGLSTGPAQLCVNFVRMAWDDLLSYVPDSTPTILLFYTFERPKESPANAITRMNDVTARLRREGYTNFASLYMDKSKLKLAGYVVTLIRDGVDQLNALPYIDRLTEASQQPVDVMSELKAVQQLVSMEKLSNLLQD